MECGIDLPTKRKTFSHPGTLPPHISVDKKKPHECEWSLNWQRWRRKKHLFDIQPHPPKDQYNVFSVQKYLIERENLEGDDEEKDAGHVEFISGPLGQLQKQVGLRVYLIYVLIYVSLGVGLV